VTRGSSDQERDLGAAGLVAPELADDIGWLLEQLVRGYNKALESELGELPGGVRSLQVLRAAVRGCSRNQVEIARLCGIDRTLMVRIVDELEAHGFVERRPDPSDRRAHLITPTDAGRTALDKALEAVVAARARVLVALDDHCAAQFLEQLRTLVAGVLDAPL